MVTFLCGKSGCTVMTDSMCLKCGTWLTEQERQQPVALPGAALWHESLHSRSGLCETCKTYKPRCLAPLPRKRCAFIYPRTVTRYGSKQDMYVVPAPCTAKPLKNGWCNEHQYVQAFLEEGARIGYPRLRINKGLWLGCGVCGWEAFAERYPRKRMQEVLQAIARWNETGKLH